MKAVVLIIRGAGLLGTLLLSAAYADMLRVGHFEEATRTLLAAVVILLACDCLAKLFKEMGE